MKELNQFRSVAYRSARIVGDVNAVTRGPKATGMRFLIVKPIWRLFARMMGGLFR